MNLDDLRQELTTRADEARQPDLLAGVHHRIRRTKQRRVAAALTATAAVAALAISVVPGALSSTEKTPDPAERTPGDYQHNDLLFTGDYLGGPLLKAWAGKKGETRIEFTWQPGTKDLTLRPYCRASDTSKFVRVTFNDFEVIKETCASGVNEPSSATSVAPDDIIWSSVGNGTLKVGITLVSESDQPVTESAAQLGLGIYESRSIPSSGFPSRAPEADPADYVRDGLRYRAKVGEERLETATIGALGQSEVSVTWTPTSRDVEFQDLCVAPRGQKLIARVIVNGRHTVGGSCSDSGSTRRNSSATVHGNDGFKQYLKLGEPNTITLQLAAMSTLKPVNDPRVRLGFAIYRTGPLRDMGVGTRFRLAESIEYDGYLYKLTQVKTTPAAANAAVSANAPAGKPFLVSAGGFGEDLNDTKEHTRAMTLTGLAAGPQLNQAKGIGLPGVGLYAAPSQQAAPLTAKVTGPGPYTGTLYIALYEPAN